MYDKVNLFHYRRSSRINVYTLEDTVGYSYGYMAPNTSYVRYFDLYLYDDGFVLQMPEPASPETVDAFEPPEKLFNVLKQSARWGTSWCAYCGRYQQCPGRRQLFRIDACTGSTAGKENCGDRGEYH